MFLIWIGIASMCSLPLLPIGVLLAFHVRVVRRYVPIVVRIFQEKPLFIVPKGAVGSDSEKVEFRTSDGLTLRGCYLSANGPRRGVIAFGLEFGSNCWSCRSYCEHLIEAGFDVLAYEPRNQGDSDRIENYDPLQWVTEYEVIDARAALDYLKARPDADPRGVGFFGISKGAGAMLQAASEDGYVRCFVTDGVFATFGTLLPYMRQWFRIYNTYFPLELIPDWYIVHVARVAMRKIGAERRCQFVALEPAIAKLAPRPLLMIHGAGDSYIKPDMARTLFALAGEPKEFWLVADAKHNGALHVAGDEYRQRILRFFERNLVGESSPPAESEGIPRREMLARLA